MDFDKYYESLNEFDDKIDVEERCCDSFENYVIYEGITSCKVCRNIISNISDGAEWRYYGSNDSKTSDPTRCGMPTNILLPKSSIGSRRTPGTVESSAFTSFVYCSSLSLSFLIDALPGLK